MQYMELANSRGDASPQWLSQLGRTWGRIARLSLKFIIQTTCHAAHHAAHLPRAHACIRTASSLLLHPGRFGGEVTKTPSRGHVLKTTRRECATWECCKL